MILIVEDNPSLCRLWVDLLSHHGHLVRGANTGSEAVTAAIESMPDLVVMDLDLPDMNGFELIAALRPLGSFPIVALTGAGGLGDLSRLGFAETHIKPMNNAGMLAIADRLLPPKGQP